MACTKRFVKTSSDRMSKDALRLKGIKENKVFIGPKSVDLHLTSICNLNCSYCWFHSSLLSKKYGGKHIDFPLFMKTIDDLHALGVESLTFSGEGEPTLHPMIKDMIDYANERGFRLKILTNGTFGNDLIKYMFKVDSLTINLATLSPEKYKKLQSESGYRMIKRAIENIINISKIKKKMGLKKPKVNIGFVINEENHSEIERIFSFANKYGVGIHFRLMKARKENERLILSKRSAEEVKNYLKKIIRKDRGSTNAKNVYHTMLKPGFLEKNMVFYPFENCHRIFYYDIFKNDKIRCFIGWYFSHINTDGNVYLCCQNPFLIAGNIKKNSFKRIWNSEKYMKLRLKCKSEIDVNKYKWMECRHCPFEKKRKIFN